MEKAIGVDFIEKFGKYTECFYDNYPELWGNFIQGASGHLNFKVNNDIEISNGTSVIIHSLTFEEIKKLTISN